MDGWMIYSIFKQKEDKNPTHSPRVMRNNLQKQEEKESCSRCYGPHRVLFPTSGSQYEITSRGRSNSPNPKL